MLTVKIHIQQKTKTIVNTKKSYFVTKQTFNVTVDTLCMISSVCNIKNISRAMQRCQLTYESGVNMSVNSP